MCHELKAGHCSLILKLQFTVLQIVTSNINIDMRHVRVVVAAV